MYAYFHGNKLAGFLSFISEDDIIKVNDTVSKEFKCKFDTVTYAVGTNSHSPAA